MRLNLRLRVRPNTCDLSLWSPWSVLVGDSSWQLLVGLVISRVV